jgi:hypothetical protein
MLYADCGYTGAPPQPVSMAVGLRKEKSMADLYVIGNGFDLFHKLPTRYIDFSLHSGSKLEDLETYFYFDFSDDQMWWNFENKLGDFDGKLFFDDYCLNDKCESWGEAQGVADDISEWADKLVDEIRESFESWIESIDLYKVRPILNIDRHARYLSFNYTSVLTRLFFRMFMVSHHAT